MADDKGSLDFEDGVDEPRIKVRFQGVQLTARQVEVLRNIVHDAVAEFAGHPDHGVMRELHQMLLPVPMPFDPRPDDFFMRGGSDGSPIPYGATPSRGHIENEEAWRRYDRARRG
ncbi:MAG TPA: hypothetical protein VHG72_13975 [Polyangia bacterium]|nr:hypothetical protein [Polyangia bacterium]